MMNELVQARASLTSQLTQFNNDFDMLKQGFIVAKQEQVERIEDKLANIIHDEQSRLRQLNTSKPGLLATPAKRKKWKQEQAKCKANILKYHNRLDRVKVICDRMDQQDSRLYDMAYKKARFVNPELAKKIDNTNSELAKNQLEISRLHKLDLSENKEQALGQTKSLSLKKGV